MSGAAILIGQISINIERLVVINLGLTAVSLFGIVIAIFIGIGLVSKEIERRTLYTVLSRPVRRWEFIVGKFFGLAGTLVVNTFFMAIGVFGALLYVTPTMYPPEAAPVFLQKLIWLNPLTHYVIVFRDTLLPEAQGPHWGSWVVVLGLSAAMLGIGYAAIHKVRRFVGDMV